MWAKADRSRSCGDRPWHCSSGTKDLQGGIGGGKRPALSTMCEWKARLGVLAVRGVRIAGGSTAGRKNASPPPRAGSFRRTWPRWP